MSAYSSLSIANAFLERGRRDAVLLSSMQMHRLLYLAEAHSHALRNRRLIEEEPEAWDFGPVYPTVFREFARFGARTIEGLAAPIDDPAVYFRNKGVPIIPVPSPSDEDVNSFLDAVWSMYKEKTAGQLAAMSHISQGPWAKTLAAARASGFSRGNPPIAYELIASYFRPPAKAAS